jgi:hypothetical protein
MSVTASGSSQSVLSQNAVRIIGEHPLKRGIQPHIERAVCHDCRYDEDYEENQYGVLLLQIGEISDVFFCVHGL